MGYSTNPFVKWVLSRSYGQGGSVASPYPRNQVSDLIVNFPAGVGNVFDRLVDKYASWLPNPDTGEAAEIDWCFLVGGPGNGKSEASRQLAGVLNVELPRKEVGAPAPRTVPGNWPLETAPVVPGLEIVFINDASIPRQDLTDKGSHGSLYLDIHDALSKILSENVALAVFANVNRGILIEEQNALPISTPDSIGAKLAFQVIKWLATPPSNSLPRQDLSDLITSVNVDPDKPYYGQFLIPRGQTGSIHDIRVHVIFLDALSLLEPTPGSDKAIDFSSVPPSVYPYRPLGGVSDDNASRNATVAGELVGNIVDLEKWDDRYCIDPVDQTRCAAYEMCPFAQNAKWLRNAQLRQHYLDTLRAAEIAAARRFTFRDLLGYISLSILGYPEKDWVTSGQHPCDWVAEHVRNAHNNALVTLISHRIYMNIFSSTGFEVAKRGKTLQKQGDYLYNATLQHMLGPANSLGIPAFERAFISIDPARDVEAWDHGLRTKVLDAIEALDVERPSEVVTTWPLIASDAHSAIERDFDQALLDEVVNEVSASQTSGNAKAPLLRGQFLRKWRCIALLRHIGLATGNFAFKPALLAWLAQQAVALQSGGLLDLGRGIQALILPTNSMDQLLLAPMRPRTYALTKDLPAHTLLVDVSLADLRVDIVSQGDILIAEVQLINRRKADYGKIIASIVIDLAIAREALLHVTSDTDNFTDIGSSAFARIERARAALIGRLQMKNTQIYFTDEVGKLYRLSANPIGQIPLRITPPQR